MKIQLTLNALERLLGNDTEIEVELRQSVVDEFSRRHLKALANEALLKTVKSRLVEEIHDVVWGKPHGQMLDHALIPGLIKETARDIVSASSIPQWINTEVSGMGYAKLNEIIKTAIRDEVAEAVSKLRPQIIDIVASSLNIESHR